MSNDNDDTARPWREKLADFNVFGYRVVTAKDFVVLGNLPVLREFWSRFGGENLAVLQKKLKDKYHFTDDEAQQLCDRAASKKIPGKYIVSEMIKANPDFGKLEARTFAHDFLGVLLFAEEVHQVQELKYAASTDATDSESDS